MPRRLPVRPQVIIGNIFVVLVTFVIGIIYYAYVFLVWLPKSEGKWCSPKPRPIKSVVVMQTTGGWSCCCPCSTSSFLCWSGRSFRA